MSEKDDKPQVSDDQGQKPPASPVCYLDQFPEYFEDEDEDDPVVDNSGKKGCPEACEP